jgi:hypothetical protein
VQEAVQQPEPPPLPQQHQPVQQHEEPDRSGCPSGTDGTGSSGSSSGSDGSGSSLDSAGDTCSQEQQPGQQQQEAECEDRFAAAFSRVRTIRARKRSKDRGSRSASLATLALPQAAVEAVAGALQEAAEEEAATPAPPARQWHFFTGQCIKIRAASFPSGILGPGTPARFTWAALSTCCCPLASKTQLLPAHCPRLPCLPAPCSVP